MNSFLNTANRIEIVIITLATVGVIALGRKTEKAVFPGVLIIVNLVLLLYHSYILNSISSLFENQISQIYLCLAMDFLWLLIILYYNANILSKRKVSYRDSLCHYFS